MDTGHASAPASQTADGSREQQFKNSQPAAHETLCLTVGASVGVYAIGFKIKASPGCGPADITFLRWDIRHQVAVKSPWGRNHVLFLKLH